MDTSEPSTNGISASNLYRLSSSLSDETYAKKAKETVAGFESEMLQYPWLFASFMPSIVAGHLGVKSVVLSGTSDAEARESARRPREGLATIVRLDDSTRWLRERNPLLRDFGNDGKTRILICENGVCREENGTGRELPKDTMDLSDVGAALPTQDGAPAPGAGESAPAAVPTQESAVGAGAGESAHGIAPTGGSAPGGDNAKFL
jgi:uncharacterized protein YyaL (SSP411 family)